MYSYTNTQQQMRAYKRIHVHRQAQTHTWTHMHLHTHTHTHTRIHKQIDIRPHAHKNRHTHLHTQPVASSSSLDHMDCVISLNPCPDLQHLVTAAKDSHVKVHGMHIYVCAFKLYNDDAGLRLSIPWLITCRPASRVVFFDCMFDGAWQMGCLKNAISALKRIIHLVLDTNVVLTVGGVFCCFHILDRLHNFSQQMYPIVHRCLTLKRLWSALCTWAALSALWCSSTVQETFSW